MRERGHQRETFGHGVKDQRREAHLGRDAKVGKAAAPEEPGAKCARACLEHPGQREPCGDPEQRGQPLPRQHLRQEVERDHSRRGRESEGARPLQQRGTPPRREREAAAEQRGDGGESGRERHYWRLSQNLMAHPL